MSQYKKLLLSVLSGGIEEIINIQPKNGKAKPYQVKQIRAIILRYRLGGDVV